MIKIIIFLLFNVHLPFSEKIFNEVNLVVNNQLYHILGGDINEEALGVMYFDTFSDRVWSEQ
ncbi:hypothetical protein SAMN05428987_4113 [Paenibacillus sp. CF095]|nr:hypothetical protein SAMN05428987_4113 [Paenibacillus sp. CF095]